MNLYIRYIDMPLSCGTCEYQDFDENDNDRPYCRINTGLGKYETITYKGVTASYNFPKYATYEPPHNKILTILDFKRGELIKFDGFCEKPSSSGRGNAFYRSVYHPECVDIVNISDLIPAKRSDYK